jgi:hypothetical protein
MYLYLHTYNWCSVFLSMITGDMLTFGIIYLIFLLAFSQAFYYLYKNHPGVNDLLFVDYPSTWMALYQMTLGQYSVRRSSLALVCTLNCALPNAYLYVYVHCTCGYLKYDFQVILIGVKY